MRISTKSWLAGIIATTAGVILMELAVYFEIVRLGQQHIVMLSPIPAIIVWVQFKLKAREAVHEQHKK